jgi:hypothetical protein
MVAHAEPFTFMRALTLSRTDVADLAPLARFVHLERLEVSSTRVRDLAPLAALPRLRHVGALRCDLAKGTVDALHHARPQIVVRASRHSQLE